MLNTQNALKISTLTSLLCSFYLSSTIFSLCYAYFTTVINTKVQKSICGGGGVLISAGGWKNFKNHRNERNLSSVTKSFLKLVFSNFRFAWIFSK